MRIGITCVGSGIGQSVVTSCKLSSLPLHIVGFDSNPFAFGAFDCDEQVVTPQIKDPLYVETLLALAEKYRLDILIPGLDYELILLSSHARRFRDIGTEVLIASEDFIRRCRDKYEFLNDLNQSFPAFVKSYRQGEAIAAIHSGELQFPLIAKPGSGSGSEGVLILREERDLSQTAEDFVVQKILFPTKTDPGYEEYIAGIKEQRLVQVSELSVQYLVGKTGRILGRCASVNRLKSGVPVEIVPYEDLEINAALDPCVSLLVRLGLRGPINIQGRMTADGPAVFELNPRFTGITGLRAALGYNEVEAAIADYLEWDQPLPSLSLNKGRIGVRQMLDRVVVPDYRPALQTVVKKISGDRRKIDRSILVTGGSGFLGRHVVDQILGSSSTDSVTCVTRNPELEQDRYREEKRLSFVSWEALLSGGVNLANIDVIVHMAFARSNTDPEQIADSLAKTQALFHLVGKHHIPRLINLSSQAVYGLDTLPPWREDTTLRPGSVYGMAKLASELMAVELGRRHQDIAVASLRFARLVGPGCKTYELPYQFMQAALSEGVITIEGGTQVFDLLDVRDAAAAILRLVNIDPCACAKVYNVGSGTTIGITALAEHANRIAQEFGKTGAKIQIKETNVRQKFGMDITRFRQDSGWTPSIDILQTMRDIAEEQTKEQPK